jgi:flagellin
MVREQQTKLASGFRINKAADDAAGLAISEMLRADIRSLGQARRNANDAVAMLQVAEGGLEEITNITIRLRELSIQAASDTVGTNERRYLNNEFMALKDEVDRIALSTEFNGTRLLIGNASVTPDLVKNHNSSPLEIQVGKDYFSSVDSLSNSKPVNVIRINMEHINALTDGQGSLGIGNSLNSAGTNVLTKQDAQLSINAMDEALQKIASYRADIGAIQNRLISTDTNLGITIENLSAARSRIKDADFAMETSKLTEANIMQQAGAAVLLQANQMPELALQLLK